MFGLGVTESLVILAIALLVFGTARLRKVGSGMKSAANDFRNALSHDEASRCSGGEDAKVSPGQADARRNT